MKYSLKLSKSKYYLFAYLWASIFFTQIRIQAQNSKAIEKLPVNEKYISILNNLDSVSLEGLEIEVNHYSYYWLKKANQFQNDSEFPQNIILFNKKIIAISDNLNKTLGAVRKMQANIKLMKNPEFRNILGEILDSIETLMENLEELNNRISEK